MTNEDSLWAKMGRATSHLEETAIALLLGLMTIITFYNVILRFGFESGVVWGLEATSILFAWLVLFGISYCVKITAHLGVDSVINLFSGKGRRRLAMTATLISIVYAALLLKGGYDYFSNFANLPATTGHWFPTGFQEMKPRDYQGFYELTSIPMPDWLRFIEPAMLFDGDPPYNKAPRFLAYFILPFGASLLLFRLVQAFVGLWKGTRETLIVSHEAEDDVKDVAARLAEEDA